jgi:hypothetical protein
MIALELKNLGKIVKINSKKSKKNMCVFNVK